MTTQQPPNKPVARGLGRGLDALMPARPPPRPNSEGPAYGDNNVFTCAIDMIVPQTGQPRRHFDSAKLDELAQSLKDHGLLEPLVVRRRPGTDKFELIAGERRWRAAQRAGLKEILVVVRDVSAHDAFELALVENVQREDLDAIEFAEALDRLLRDHSYTQESLAKRVGKDRSTIANALRLLKLPEKVRESVVSGELSEGHARALLGAPDERAMTQLAEKVIRGHLSVRQAEELVRDAKRASSPSKPGSKPGVPTKSASVRDLEQRLMRHLGTRCEVRDRQGKGEIVVHYASLDELDRLLEVLL
ncbi:MAG TPA: ParB/RepB/Spo0J family partition protein [Polyangiaceae bacterium]